MLFRGECGFDRRRGIAGGGVCDRVGGSVALPCASNNSAMSFTGLGSLK
jgi:hypothetical protein